MMNIAHRFANPVAEKSSTPMLMAIFFPICETRSHTQWSHTNSRTTIGRKNEDDDDEEEVDEEMGSRNKT